MPGLPDLIWLNGNFIPYVICFSFPQYTPEALVVLQLTKQLHKMRIAITGARGTVGREVVKLCSQAGHHTVQMYVSRLEWSDN